MTAARDQIIETTCTLLELQGYHATGLNEIIRESGSPKGSLYHYFPGGKEELVAAALNRAGDVAHQRIKAQLTISHDLVQVMRDFMMDLAAGIEASAYQAGGAITIVAMEVASSQRDRLREECERIYELWRQAFRDRMVEAGIESGRAERLAMLILAAIEGGILLCRTYRSPEPLVAVAEEITALLKIALSHADKLLAP